MRCVKLLEKGSLLDSEFVLFVDDDILEVVKVDAFLEEGVGSYDEVDSP